MSEATDQLFAEVIAEVIASYPKDISFPTGEGSEILTEAERRAVIVLHRIMPVSVNAIEAVRARLGTFDSYHVVILGVRVAVYCVREGVPQAFPLSILCLTIDDRVDWRDILGALSIIERCAGELDIEFEPLVRDAAMNAVERRQTTMLEYLRREEVMRDVSVMGFNVTGKRKQYNVHPALASAPWCALGI